MNKIKTKILVILFLSFILVNPVFAAGEFACIDEIGSEQYSSLLNNVSQANKAIKSVKAKFSQESYLLGLDRIEKSSGDVSFEKTAKMRWDYKIPEKQLFVMDGKNVWYYQPSQNQVMVRDLHNSFKSDVPVSFLLGLGDLAEQFTLNNACRTNSGILLNLNAKQNDSSLSRFLLIVRPTDYVTIGAKITDVGGNETSIVLRELILNQPIKTDEFSFNPPKGIDIIDERASNIKPVVPKTDIKIGEEDIL